MAVCCDIRRVRAEKAIGGNSLGRELLRSRLTGRKMWFPWWGSGLGHLAAVAATRLHREAWMLLASVPIRSISKREICVRRRDAIVTAAKSGESLSGQQFSRLFCTKRAVLRPPKTGA